MVAGWHRLRRKRTKKVSFWATQKVTKPIKVTFRTSTGEQISFWKTKKVLKPIRVEFYIERKGRRRRRTW